MIFPRRPRFLFAVAAGLLAAACSDGGGSGRGSGSTPQFTVPATLALPGSVLRTAQGDLDGNGRAEVVASTPGALLVLEPDARGQLRLARTLTTGGAPFDVQLEQLDADTHLDLVATDRATNELIVFRGRGNGGFHAPVRVAVGASPEQVLAADLDGDGDLDLAVRDDRQRVLLNDGQAGFTELTSFALPGVTCMAAAPLDATPGADLVLGGATLEAVLDPTAPTPTMVSSLLSEPITRLVLADVTGDGTPDAVGLATRVLVLRGQGPGLFTAWQTVSSRFDTSGGELVAAQLDDVGPLTVIDPHEILVSIPNGTCVALLRNHGSGFLGADVRVFTGTPPGAIAAGHFDRDDGLDLSVALGAPDRVSVFSGDGGGLLEGPRLQPRLIPTSSPGDLAVVDVTGDGTLDLVNVEPLHGVGYLPSDPQGGFPQAPFGIALNTASYVPNRVAVTDLDGDGRRDLVVLVDPRPGSTPPATPAIVTIQSRGPIGTGVLLEPPTYHPVSGPAFAHFVLGDVDGDAIVDLVASRPDAGDVQVMLGNGDTTFSLGGSHPAVAGAAGLALTHLNSDAVLDLVVTGTGGTAVLIGRTDGSVDPPAIHAPHLAGESLVLTSLDGDAFEDVVIAYRDTGAGPGLACFTADRMGGLLAPVTVAEGVEASHLAAVGDMLGDGSADVLANDVLGDQLVILTGTGLAKEPLRAVLSLAAGLDSAGLGAGDLDNDGFLDLVSSHAHGLIVHTSAR